VGSGIGKHNFTQDAVTTGAVIGSSLLLGIGYMAFKNRSLGD
jgi:hypothetical protein